MRRRVRQALVLGSSLLLLAIVVAWGRSYFFGDQVRWRRGQTTVSIQSASGALFIEWHGYPIAAGGQPPLEDGQFEASTGRVPEGGAFPAPDVLDATYAQTDFTARSSLPGFRKYEWYATTFTYIAFPWVAIPLALPALLVVMGMTRPPRRGARIEGADHGETAQAESEASPLV